MYAEAVLEPGPAAETIRIRDVVRFWHARATPRAAMRLAIATLLALLYAGGTAAASAIVARLVQSNDIAALIRDASPVYVAAFALFALRPLFYVGHVHFVTASVGAVIDEEPLAPVFVNYMLMTFIILSRDLPAVVILSAAMLWHGGIVGLAVAMVVFSSLVLAVPLRNLADRFYGKPLSEPRQRRVETVLHKRASRSWAEASSDASFTALIIGLLIVGYLYGAGATTAVVGTTVTALLMTTPTRRLARLLGDKREHRNKLKQGDVLDFE